MSIGEVLGILKPEFPDITVSKIRFLEGAGLVQPDRSASGYRKFSEDDVARLRFVLRAQRDQYLAPSGDPPAHSTSNRRRSRHQGSQAGVEAGAEHRGRIRGGPARTEAGPGSGAPSGRPGPGPGLGRPGPGVRTGRPGQARRTRELARRASEASGRGRPGSSIAGPGTGIYGGGGGWAAGRRLLWGSGAGNRRDLRPRRRPTPSSPATSSAGRRSQRGPAPGTGVRSAS
jgi:hypothetical protein